MTDREAITMLEGSACTTVMRRAINKGIEALQEREERSKGCEFCKGIEDEFTFYTHTSCDGGYVVEWHDANCCPVCGRALKGE